VQRLAAMRRGFTLVELMVVVAIVGIMAAIGVVMLREYVFTARSVEAAGMVQSIRAAEESWKASHGTYFNVSDTLDNYYPTRSPNRQRRSFYLATNDDLTQKWKLLNPTVPGPVQFGYSVVAGLPGSAAKVPNTSEKPVWPATTDPWYVIEAKGDKDEDGSFAYFVTSSFGPDVFTERPEE
jgi:type IV pilus assembly protein PilA